MAPAEEETTEEVDALDLLASGIADLEEEVSEETTSNTDEEEE